ncbi:hypothetical protein BDP27DRAFT_1320109 [Rhodocollybia butyracea]|uniref:Uncharacterized protein n=1 Tax=Rhodocollybia butyracea TaxID=206335 RepID=A0A9P5PUA7_9AGAR|nr:hypothetical protein BDP27DRAFT_1320109 [Rhodocollybia butyracea]
MGPLDGWCYEGKHTTDAKQARFHLLSFFPSVPTLHCTTTSSLRAAPSGRACEKVTDPVAIEGVNHEISENGEHNPKHSHVF